MLFLQQLPSQRSCRKSLRISRSCRAWGASTPLFITPQRPWPAVSRKKRPTPMLSPEAPSATPTVSYRRRTKRRTRRVTAELGAKEEGEEPVGKPGVQPTAWSSPGPSSRRGSRPSITTCTGAPLPRTKRWASLECSPQARAAKLRPRCPTSRFSTWPCQGRPRSLWARRRRKRCTRRRWRGCRSGRRGWRTGRKKGWCLLHHWRCWIALFSRGATPTIKCSRGKVLQSASSDRQTCCDRGIY